MLLEGFVFSGIGNYTCDCSGDGMRVNLINISYCTMKILPYQNECLSEYCTKSVLGFHFKLNQGIRR